MDQRKGVLDSKPDSMNLIADTLMIRRELKSPISYVLTTLELCHKYSNSEHTHTHTLKRKEKITTTTLLKFKSISRIDAWKWNRSKQYKKFQQIKKKGQQSRRMKQTYKTTKKNIQIGLEIAQYLWPLLLLFQGTWVLFSELIYWLKPYLSPFPENLMTPSQAPVVHMLFIHTCQ